MHASFDHSDNYRSLNRSYRTHVPIVSKNKPPMDRHVQTPHSMFVRPNEQARYMKGRELAGALQGMEDALIEARDKEEADLGPSGLLSHRTKISLARRSKTVTQADRRKGRVLDKPQEVFKGPSGEVSWRTKNIPTSTPMSQWKPPPMSNHGMLGGVSSPFGQTLPSPTVLQNFGSGFGPVSGASPNVMTLQSTPHSQMFAPGGILPTLGGGGGGPPPPMMIPGGAPQPSPGPGPGFPQLGGGLGLPKVVLPPGGGAPVPKPKASPPPPPGAPPGGGPPKRFLPPPKT